MISLSLSSCKKEETKPVVDCKCGVVTNVVITTMNKDVRFNLPGGNWFTKPTEVPAFRITYQNVCDKSKTISVLQENQVTIGNKNCDIGF